MALWRGLNHQACWFGSWNAQKTLDVRQQQKKNCDDDTIQNTYTLYEISKVSKGGVSVWGIVWVSLG